MAKIVSNSQLVPKAFRGRPSDVFIAMGIAKSLGVSIFEVLSGIDVIEGKPAFGAAFSISLANRKKSFATSITYETEGEGDSLKVSAVATTHDGKTAKATVTMDMAKKEGWVRNKKYQTMPEHMLRYRAATHLIRQYCPEVFSGFQTPEEVADIECIEINKSRIKALEERLLGLQKNNETKILEV